MRIDKKIKALPWPEKYHGGMQHFKVSLSWPVVGHERFLVVTFSMNHNGQRYFADKRDFRLICSKKQNRCAALYEDGKQKRCSLADAMRGWCCSPGSCYPEISEKDEAALGKWLGVTVTDNHMMRDLDDWSQEAKEAEILAERDRHGELRDEDVYLCPEELPEGLVDYIRRTVLPDDTTLIYKKGNVRGRCFACGEKVRAIRERFRQNEVVNCPNCGTRVKCLLEDSNRFGVDFVENVAAIQRGTDGKTVFVRLWHIRRDMTAEWRDIPKQLDEVARYAMRGAKAAKWQKEEKYNFFMNTWRERNTMWERHQDTSRIYDGSYYFFLPKRWREILDGTSLQYCELEAYTERRQPSRKNPIRFMLDWCRYPAVELIWKAGYCGLVDEKIIGVDKENRNAILWTRGAIREAFPFPIRLLKAKPPKEWSMYDVKRTKEAWKLASDGLIKETEIAELERIDYRLDCIIPALRGASVRKVTTYIEEKAKESMEKNKEEKRPFYRRKEPEATAQTYRDYLTDCVKLGLDLTDKTILFPRDIDRAHARTTAQIQYKSDSEMVAKFDAQRKKLEKRNWQNGDLLIRAAGSQKELIEEGAYLHHCVGGYAERVAKGETAIYLIRRVSDPTTPFYTLEYRDNLVIQCRTRNNASYMVDDEIAAFVAAWLEQIKKKTKKRKVA